MYTEARLLLRLSTGVKISDRSLNAFIEMLDAVVAMSGFVAVSKAFLSFFFSSNKHGISVMHTHSRTHSQLSRTKIYSSPAEPMS